MTNEALVTVAHNLPKLTSFRFSLYDARRSLDDITGEPFDDGFRTIVESCKDLRRISIAAQLTNDGLDYIGRHANKVEVLSLAFTGDSDMGLHYILRGCKSLKRLQITNCPFSGTTLLVNTAKLEALRYLWMSKCNVTVVQCRLLGDKMPCLTVEIIDDPPNDDDDRVTKLYVYRTLAGPRSDIPRDVEIASIIG
jgi:transport inhibitor response 1